MRKFYKNTDNILQESSRAACPLPDMIGRHFVVQRNMMKSRIYAGTSILLIAYIASLGVYASKRQTVPERLNSDDPALVSAGKTVYVSHCAACHGAHLEGQTD